MSSSYQAYNLSYDQPSSHAQQYWNSININDQYPPPKPSQTSFDYSGPHLTANVPLGNRAGLNRTPSPTPSEVKELQTGAIDFKAMSNWRFWIRREWLCAYNDGFVFGSLCSVHVRCLVFRVLRRPLLHHRPHHLDNHIS